MKRIIFLIGILFIVNIVLAQKDTALINEINRFQKELIQEYTNAGTSPLSREAKKEFKGIHFFPVSMQYVVTAKFTRTANEKIFEMPTSGKETKQYVKYGEVTFTIKDKEYTLGVYQSISLASQRQYRDYLFIPFRDATSGKETYGGGRYIDLTIPQTNTVVINFNKAYQPYCAYTEGYNCPIPPRENYVPVKIEAGVKY
ncbi:DUF1684 domain-containing protein [Panacibacter ginsenosidivorans]|uniref:DUF1684 domain-containing protein n=1 Tax=Panacibacter ginsenosidivorans TaxID=1813871 RepID=A0A5B8V8P5_9BACT|nr:DUF1684 domain-containing protein [Panacibacter ginsenosidivorans]QEC67867.1 DUF1684 domain-containing protein [Panacibacter ginsenosidivorans]